MTLLKVDDSSSIDYWSTIAYSATAIDRYNSFILSFNRPFLYSKLKRYNPSLHAIQHSIAWQHRYTIPYYTIQYNTLLNYHGTTNFPLQNGKRAIKRFLRAPHCRMPKTQAAGHRPQVLTAALSPPPRWQYGHVPDHRQHVHRANVRQLEIHLVVLLAAVSTREQQRDARRQKQ